MPQDSWRQRIRRVTTSAGTTGEEAVCWSGSLSGTEDEGWERRAGGLHNMIYRNSMLLQHLCKSAKGVCCFRYFPHENSVRDFDRIGHVIDVINKRTV